VVWLPCGVAPKLTKWVVSDMSEAQYAPEVPVPVPVVPGQEMPTEVADERESFAKITEETPRDTRAEEAFIASKAQQVRTHPTLDRAERELALTELTERIGRERLEDALEKEETPPVPGGVGYGVFYDSAFKSAFFLGTSLYFEIVCPPSPGGNVNNFLYLTGMNRAGLSVEAFVSYFAQTEPRFKVFDWARTDQWQINIPFGNLGSYLGTTYAHGAAYQTLRVWNNTYQRRFRQWRNEALLHNRAAGRWDVVYRYDYAATQAQQTGGWIGSWGPIVETFQSPYVNTNRVGALGTSLSASGPWQLLSATDSYIRTDNVGFHVVFLDPNYALVVES
jgi:hypothetical protein